MQEKNDLVDSLYERKLLNDNEEIVLSDGFDAALIGVSTSEPKIAIYDFWKALDCIIKKNPDLDFNDALECAQKHFGQFSDLVLKLAQIISYSLRNSPIQSA